MAADGWDGILEDGERIIWQGRPDGAVVVRDLLSFETFFALFVTAFALFWMGGVIFITSGLGGGGINWFGLIFSLFGVPFLGLGLYQLVGRFYWDAHLRRHSFYSLSTKAAYIAVDMAGQRKLKRYEITADSPLELEDGAPGSVWFATQVASFRTGGMQQAGVRTRSRKTYTTARKVGFERIAEAREVFRQIQSVRLSARGE